MNFLKKPLMLVLVILGCSLKANAEEQGTIIWAYMDFTPYMFVEGPNKGQGIVDRALEIVKKRLPNMKYEQTVAFNVRAYEMLKNQPNVCVGTLLRNPDREKFMEFTTMPTVRILPNGIITTRSRLESLKPFMNENGELRLDAVLADGKHKLLVEQERSFGAHIDGIIKNPEVQASVVRTNNIPILESRLLKLIRQQEYDLLIGYAIELKAAANRSGLNVDDFAFIPIVGQPSLLSLPIACSKSDLGKQFVAAVDKVLAEPAVQQEIAQFYRQWLDSETGSRYDRLVKQANASR